MSNEQLYSISCSCGSHYRLQDNYLVWYCGLPGCNLSYVRSRSQEPEEEGASMMSPSDFKIWNR
jgi:hypothetical protein